MAIAFDAKSQLSGTFTTGFGSWTHTPVGTPAGVIVLITQGVADTDDVTSVTYGGIAMTRIAFDHQAGGGDPTAAYLYFLGEGVPSGAQTVAIQGNNRFATACVTVTADSGSTAVDVFNSGNGTANNPTLTLDYTDGLADWIALVCMADGAGAVSGANIDTGTSLYENDLGAQVGMFSYIEGTGGTSQSFSTTANNASWAWCGAVIEELVAVSLDQNQAKPQVAPGLTPFDYPVPWMGVGTVSNDVSVNAECPQVSIVSNDSNGSVAPNAGNATVTLTANDGDPKVAVNAQNATVTFTANNSPSSVSVNAGLATASFTANNSTPTVAPSGSDTVVTFAANDLGHEIVQGFFDYNPYAPGLGYPWSLPAPWSGTEATQAAPVNANAECANVTFVSNDATKSESVNSGNSTVAFVANNDAPSVLVNAGNAVASFVAQDATKSESANAGSATTSLVANNNTPSVSVNAGVASVTLTANQPASGRTPTTAVTSIVASDASIAVSTSAGNAQASVIANNGTPSTAVNTDAPVVSFTAQDAVADEVSDWIYKPLQPGLTPFDEPQPWFGSHIFINPDKDVQAGSGDVTVAANSPGKSVSVNAGVASVSISADSPAAALRVAAGPAAVGIVAPNAAASVVAYAGVASIALSIDASTTKVGPSSGLSSILWTSLDGTIPVQFLGPPDLIIKKLSTSTTVNDKSNSVTCSAKTGVLTVTDLTNGLIIRKVDNTVTVNDN